MYYKINVEFFHRHNIGNTPDFKQTLKIKASSKGHFVNKTSKQVNEILDNLSYDNSYIAKIKNMDKIKGDYK